MVRDRAAVFYFCGAGDPGRPIARTAAAGSGLRFDRVVPTHGLFSLTEATKV